MISQKGDNMGKDNTMINTMIQIGDDILYSMNRQSPPTIPGKVTNMRNLDVYINGDLNKYTGFVRRIDEVTQNTKF